MKILSSIDSKPCWNYAVNCFLQSVHKDSKVILNESDRLKYGGARFIDAETFIKKHSQVKLEESFVAGSYGYKGTLLTPDNGESVKVNVPTVYKMNGWE